ncbi:hypothetical protein PO124_29875 [Bacillus licheniformis]|nr:hypothetical protein [Bacillus licheniformis]
MERGVTVKKRRLEYWGRVGGFTESALVQMAGRAGRHPEHTDGDVCFFHYGRTKSMNAARRHIQT